MQETFNINQIWAKTNPRQPLLMHMINTGMVARVLLEDSTVSYILEYLIDNMQESKQKIINFVTYIVAMHDIGKCHPIFQGKSQETLAYLKIHNLNQEDNTSGYFRHELYSEELMEGYLSNKGFNGRTLDYIIRIAAKHHEGKIGRNKKINKSIKLDWKLIQDNIEEKIVNIFPIDYIDINKSSNIDTLCMILWGLMILSDWLASDYYFDNSILKEKNSIEEYSNWSYNTAKKAIYRSGLSKQEHLESNLTYSDMWNFMKEETLRPIQRTVKDLFSVSTPELIIIEAPMGEGKTEASIYSMLKMAKDKKGFYIALPTNATSSQMYNRVKDLFITLGKDNVKLLDSTNWLVEDKSEKGNKDIDNWLTPTKRGMLGYNVIGTIDQAMLSVMTVKHSILRLIGLIGKVLIIDEIHAYDAYMSGIIEILLQWCSAFKIPVIMLSATLPKEKKMAYLQAYTNDNVYINEDTYPLLTSVENGEIKEVRVQSTYMKNNVNIELVNSNDIYTDIIARVKNIDNYGGCAAVILNTVDEVQGLYQKMRSEISMDTDIFVFHARVPNSQRTEIEKDCISKFGKNSNNRPKKAIVIATQVIEQSLDVDFDYIISSIAPIDLLLQRMGRGHRHKETKRPTWLQDYRFSVMIPDTDDFGMNGYIYAPFVLDKTVETLKQYNVVKIPEDIREIVESVYTENFAIENEMRIEKMLEYRFSQDIEKTHGKSVALKSPDKDRFGLYTDTTFTLDEDTQSGALLVARTRAGESSRRVAFIRENIVQALELDKEPLKEAAEYVLSQTLNVIEHNIVTEEAYGYNKVIEGKGLLKGILIYPIKNDMYLVNDKKIDGYILDKKLGLIIKRKMKGGD